MFVLNSYFCRELRFVAILHPKLRFLLRNTGVDSDFTQNFWGKNWRLKSLVLSIIWLSLAVIGCPTLYWTVLGCTGLYWDVIGRLRLSGLTGLYWAALRQTLNWCDFIYFCCHFIDFWGHVLNWCHFINFWCQVWIGAILLIFGAILVIFGAKIWISANLSIFGAILLIFGARFELVPSY